MWARGVITSGLFSDGLLVDECWRKRIAIPRTVNVFLPLWNTAGMYAMLAIARLGFLCFEVKAVDPEKPQSCALKVNTLLVLLSNSKSKHKVTSKLMVEERSYVDKRGRSSVVEVMGMEPCGGRLSFIKSGFREAPTLTNQRIP